MESSPFSIPHQHWSFNHKEIQAEELLYSLAVTTTKSMPGSYFSPSLLQHLDLIESSELFKILQSMPKGVLQHAHLECNDDPTFYDQIIYGDERLGYDEENKCIVFLNGKENKKSHKPLIEIERELGGKEEFMKFIYENQLMTQNDHIQLAGKPEAWGNFEKKIGKFFNIIWEEQIFKKYINHLFTKFAKNGYQRIELRAFLTEIVIYNQKGEEVEKLPIESYIKFIDEEVERVEQKYPNFSVGIIYQGIKAFPDELQSANFAKVFSLNWPRLVGIDFVNEEDLHRSLDQYDKIVEEIGYQNLSHQPTKVYHAGETNNPKNRNIEIAIKSGSKRIGHGLNIVHNLHLLEEVKSRQICFELNPVSNCVLGYCEDPRKGIAPFLLSSGIPLTINPDDPGKFGYQDSTVDFFLTLTCYNWTIRHLKLTFLYSIDHALCGEEEKDEIRREFGVKWESWIERTILKLGGDII